VNFVAPRPTSTLRFDTVARAALGNGFIATLKVLAQPVFQHGFELIETPPASAAFAFRDSQRGKVGIAGHALSTAELADSVSGRGMPTRSGIESDARTVVIVIPQRERLAGS